MAIAYLLQKVPYVFPIIGGRKVEHLLSNVEALGIALTSEQIAYLESINPLDPGFPGWMIVRTARLWRGVIGTDSFCRATEHSIIYSLHLLRISTNNR